MPFGGLLTAGVVAGGLAMKGYNAYKANKDQKQAQKALDELSKKPYDTYQVSPEMKGYYSRVLGGVNNPMGMSAAEKAASKGNVTNAINTTLYNAKGQTGGNMARYLSGAFTPQIASAANNIAINDARMRDANYNRNLGLLGGVSGQIQSIGDRNTTNALNRRMMQEQNLGQSILQNKAFKTQALEGMSSDLIGAGLTMGMGGFGGGAEAGNISPLQAARMRRQARRRATNSLANPTPISYDPSYFDTSGLN